MFKFAGTIAGILLGLFILLKLKQHFGLCGLCSSSSSSSSPPSSPRSSSKRKSKTSEKSVEMKRRKEVQSESSSSSSTSSYTSSSESSSSEDESGNVEPYRGDVERGENRSNGTVCFCFTIYGGTCFIVDVGNFKRGIKINS